MFLKPKIGLISCQGFIALAMVTLIGFQFSHAQPTSTFMRTFHGPGMNGGLSLDITTDGGFIGTGQHESSGAGSCDLYIYKVDACGEPEWFKTYGSPGEDGGKWIKQTPDGGYITVGLTYHGTGGAYDLWLMKLDAAGNIEWNKTYGWYGHDYGIFVNTTQDGGYILTGFVDGVAFGAADLVLIKTDNQGNPEWMKLYGGTEADWGDWVTQTSDGGYLVTGYTASFGAGGPDVYVIKTDAQGNIQWTKTYGGPDDDSQPWGNFATPTGDGGLVITSHTKSAGAGGFDSWTFKIDMSTGNLIWSSVCGGPLDDQSRAFEITQDGGFAVCGYSNSYGFGDYDAYIIKLSSTGTYEWAKVYGGPGWEKAIGIKQSDGKGYSLSVVTSSFGADYFDPLFIKTDSLGNLGCGVMPANMTVSNFTPSIGSGGNQTDYPLVVTEPVLTPQNYTPDDNYICFNCNTVPSFVLTDSIVCLNEPAYFVNTTSQGEVCFEDWYINGTLTSPGDVDTLVFQFSTPGVHTVSLIAGCGNITDTFNLNVIVKDRPTAAFSFTNECVDTIVDFVDESWAPDANVVAWRWDFGDGDTSVLQSPSHLYAAPGTYDVTLAIETEYGCGDTLMQQVIIHPLPEPDFSFQNVCEGFAMQFQDQSSVVSGSVVQNVWDFGDMSAPNQNTSPSYTYATYGSYDVVLLNITDFQCVAFDTQTVFVHAPVNADFSTGNNCLYQSAQFTDISTIDQGALGAWAWDFGDNIGTSTDASPQYTYSAAGTYNVQLTVTSDSGCVDSITQPVTLHPVPIAGFWADDACQFDDVVVFTDTSSISTGSIAGWNWDFGDANGGSSTDANPQYVYEESGALLVQLTVTTDSGCVDSVTIPVDIFPKPEADMQLDDACFNDLNMFTNSSSVATGSIDSTSWDFGDGNLSANYDDTHPYNAPGTYQVTLIVETDRGCKDTITGSTNVYDLPEADFDFQDVCQSEEAIFTDASTSAWGDIEMWQWDFGDNSGSSDQNPPGHQYAQPDTYSVALSVMTEFNCRDTLVQDIAIFPTATADFSETSVCYGITTEFTDLSVVNGNGNISSWQWTFGDGNAMSTDTNPSYTYSSAGSFGVSLVVSTANGCEASIERSITVYYLPEPEFTNTTVCLHESTEFTDMSDIPSGSIVISDWDFDDNGTSNLTSPSHTYSDDGFYDVLLTLTSDHQCVDSITQEVEVWPLPEPSFTTDLDEGCKPFTIAFTDVSSIASGYSIVGWEWNFGDSVGASVETNPVYTYLQDGVYDITLVLTSANGCKDSITETNRITVFPKPVADFEAQPQPTTIIDPKIHFSDSSSGAIGWIWDMGDGFTDTLQNPVHTYLDTGTYLVEQIVYNEFNCADTIYQNVIIDPDFTFYVPSGFTPDGDGINDSFAPSGIGVIEYDMRIFTRWGQQIFRTLDMETPWKGSINNEGEVVEPGVYVYSIQIMDVRKHPHFYRGYVNLVK